MRPPLDPARITAGLRETSITQVIVHAEVSSTNTEAARLATPYTLILAEHQVGGRGRLGRPWQETPRAGLATSILIPEPAAALGWVPLLTGLALHRAVREVTHVPTQIKWPNDLLASSGGKLAGILCERTPAGIVIGAGLNVDHRHNELPVPTATSLALELGVGVGEIDRTELVIAYAVALMASMSALASGGAARDGEQAAYRHVCQSIGALVDVSPTPGATAIRARVEDIDVDGRLLVRDAAGAQHRLAAGDVHHVRMAQ